MTAVSDQQQLRFALLAPREPACITFRVKLAKQVAPNSGTDRMFCPAEKE
jgi:hypothetical protein